MNICSKLTENVVKCAVASALVNMVRMKVRKSPIEKSIKKISKLLCGKLNKKT